KECVGFRTQRRSADKPSADRLHGETSRSTPHEYRNNHRRDGYQSCGLLVSGRRLPHVNSGWSADLWGREPSPAGLRSQTRDILGFDHAVMNPIPLAKIVESVAAVRKGALFHDAESCGASLLKCMLG